jgi:hypothetical protein
MKRVFTFALREHLTVLLKFFSSNPEVRSREPSSLQDQFSGLSGCSGAFPCLGSTEPEWAQLALTACSSSLSDLAPASLQNHS